ncbi:2-oxoglutarate ferredoxin oxidoreductase subunit alpha, partial [Rhodococcus sp. CC-R104]|nr:2-oxoglutarate ferredoxin oxidoreductase subunit alpha [Rhodococcus sp. CC-R104]
PANHDLMVRLRQAKIDGIAVPDAVVDDPSGEAELLVVGWGSSYGPIGEACRRARRRGTKVAHLQLRNLNPLPENLGDVMTGYKTVIAPEMNLGQLAGVLRARYLVDVQPVTKVQGLAFLADEILDAIDAALTGTLRRFEESKTTTALAEAECRTSAVREEENA